MNRYLLRIALLLLACLMVAPLGLGRGGGGGSGGGGGGGGTSGGSYGGSSGGSSRSYSGSSSSYGGSSYGGSSYYGNDYSYGGGSGSGIDLSNWQVDLIVVGLIVVVVAGLSIKDKVVSLNPYRLGNWGLLLRNADRYTRAFERIARDRQFRTPADRQAAMVEMVSLIDPNDVVDSVYSDHGSYQNGEMLGSAAESLYSMLCTAAEIDKGVEHLQLPEGSFHLDDGANVTRPAASETLCLFGLQLVSNRISPPVGTAVLESLRRSAPRHGPQSYMFFYYSPRPGETMAPSEARRLFAKVAQREELQAVG